MDESLRAFSRPMPAPSKHAMRRSEAKDVAIVPIGSQCVLATVDWFMYREDRSLIRPWRQSYNMVRADTDWRILLSIFHR
jgi:hypothetical protein